jgi:hypothetical protein
MVAPDDSRITLQLCAISRGKLRGSTLARHPYPQIHIMATGQHGKKGRYKNEDGAIGTRIRPREDIDKEDEKNCDNLAGCCDLAEGARDRFHRAAKSV